MIREFGFHFEYITGASLTVQIHLAVVLPALVVGIVMWRRKKGTPSHKYIGRVFVLLMLAAAISALFIRQINSGSFSFIHLFVPLTFFGAFNAVYYIRKRDIKRHVKAVKGMFWGALLIPGILSFFPGRTMWMMLFG